MSNPNISAPPAASAAVVRKRGLRSLDSITSFFSPRGRFGRCGRCGRTAEGWEIVVIAGSVWNLPHRTPWVSVRTTRTCVTGRWGGRGRGAAVDRPFGLVWACGLLDCVLLPHGRLGAARLSAARPPSRAARRTFSCETSRRCCGSENQTCTRRAEVGSIGALVGMGGDREAPWLALRRMLRVSKRLRSRASIRRTGSLARRLGGNPLRPASLAHIPVFVDSTAAPARAVGTARVLHVSPVTALQTLRTAASDDALAPPLLSGPGVWQPSAPIISTV